MMQILFALIPLGAPVQDEDVYKSLGVGDRIQITFRNGNTLTGNLVALPAAESRSDAPKARSSAAPFQLLFFGVKDETVSHAQELVLERWMARHPEGKLEAPDRETRGDVWKAHGVASPPALVFVDKAGGRALKLTGLQTETQLTEALIQFRATAPVETAVDYAREKSLTIDLSWEYPGLNGTLSVPKDQIKAVRKLRALDPKTIKQLEEEKKKIAEQLRRENEERLAQEEERDRQALEAARKREEENRAAGGDDADKMIREGEKLKRALEAYQKFPPPEWGPEKLEEISSKALRKMPISLNEREFMQSYALWLVAKEYYEKKKEAEPKKTEGPAPEKKVPAPTEVKPPEEKNP